jgi:hypothetical protein
MAKSSSSEALAKNDRLLPLRQQLDSFVQSLGETLIDFTALEVNTMIVNEIQGSHFEPIEAYSALYWIGHKPNIVLKDTPESLWPRYQELWDRLEKKYLLCFPDRAEQAKPLPNPDQINEIKTLMRNGTFLRSLRKFSELLSALNSGGTSQENTDIIYAQTILHLDGDVTNRFHADLLHLENPETRNFILSIHDQAVETGTKHWRGLMQFMVNLIKSALE